MKILEILNKIAQQQKMIDKNKSSSTDFISEAVEMDSTARQIKQFISNEIYPKREAKQAWIQTDANVEEYFNRLIVLLSKLATLPKEEIEEFWDVDKLIKIDYLIHNSNNKLKAVMGGVESSNISIKNNEKLYKELLKYFESENPAAVDEFLNFYGSKSNKALFEDLVNDAERNNGYIRNFVSSWLPQHIKNTVSADTLKGIGDIAISMGGINMGKYELLTALMFKGGRPNQGTGGDVMIGKVGVELKASEDASGYGKIGGQQTTFVRDPGTIISNIQVAMREFASNCYNLLAKELQTNNEAQRIFNTYIGSKNDNGEWTDSSLQYAVDQSAWATTNSKGSSRNELSNGETLAEEKQWEAMTIDAAVIDIIKTIHQINASDNINMNPKIDKVLDYAKEALKKIWSSWSKESEKDVSDLVNVYFNTSLNDILNGVNTLAYGSAKNKVATGVLIKDFEFFTKGIGFSLLKIYAKHEKFDYILLINSKADACYVLSSKIIDNILKVIKSRKAAAFTETQLPIDDILDEDSPSEMILNAIAAVDTPAASTYGGAGRGTQVGAGTKAETWEEFNNRVNALHSQKTTAALNAEKAAAKELEKQRKAEERAAKKAAEKQRKAEEREIKKAAKKIKIQHNKILELAYSHP